MKKPTPTPFARRAPLPTETVKLTIAQQIRETLRSPEVAALWNAQAQRVIRPGNKHRISKRQSHKGPYK